MAHKIHSRKQRPPKMFRPLLWFLKWDQLDVNEDKEDIIVNAINEGSLKHWHWLIKTYNKTAIRNILKKRLASEFHPESLNLAKVVFDLPALKYARPSSYSKNRRTLS